MSELFKQISRRKFIVTTGVGASAVFLKGCLGNPPEPGGAAQAKEVEPIKLTPETKPEVTKVKLGYIPIVEAAPLIIAKELGFFKRWGMPDVDISRQTSWGSMRDSTAIGSAGGGVDGGQYQMPMPHLMTEGLITNNNKIPMYLLAQLNTQGNGIAVASKHQGKGIGLDLAKGNGKALLDQLKDAKTPFTAAFTFAKVNQEFWIRYWLAAGGIDPDADVKLIAVPAAQTVANMRTGTMDAFSTGDPWPYRIVKDKIGYVAMLTAQMWKNHPEEYLALRADWVDRHPKATKAILKAVMEAQAWLDNFENRDAAAAILGRRKYFNLTPTFLRDALQGEYDMGEGQKIKDKTMATLYWKDEKGSVSYPYKSHDLWFITESLRWGFMTPETLGGSKTLPEAFAYAKKLIDKVNREDIWRQAAQEAIAQGAKFTVADIPTNTSRGVESFFDGVSFDPQNPTAYLQSLKIKKIAV